jgi:hypothetical protein
MKDIGEGTIRRIDWTELTPVVLLLRIFNVTLGLRILLIALIGLQLTVWLNALAGIMFSDPALAEQVHQGDPLFFVSVPFDIFCAGIQDAVDSIKQNLMLLLWWFPGVALVWIICGGMICRIVAVRLTIDESESIGTLLLFLRKRGISFISAPLLMLIGLLCCFLPVKIAGWLLAVPFLNYVIAVLFPIPFFFACLTIILALVWTVGFMLLFAAVSTDGSDGFDAISRMFSYVSQRPLHYLVYWLCCGLLGYLGFLLIQFLFVYPAINLCWSTVPADFEFAVTFWAGVFYSIPFAYVITWFWTSSTAIYLLLRRSVDATPFNEVYRVSPPTVRSLPTIKSDEHGAPEIVPPEME